MPIVPCLAVGLFLVITCSYPDWTQDDAFITFRYSKNLVEGYGPVFNPGERVEGYTNFLWMILMAGVYWTGGDLEFMSRLLGIISGVLLVWLCWWIGARIMKHPPLLTIIAPCLLAVFPGFAAESIEGLETSFFSMLLMFGIGCALRERQRGSGLPLHAAIFALASMTRPEGVMVYILVEACIFINGWLCGRIPYRYLLTSLALFLLVFGPYYAWRYSYYGYPFPNTFYAKTGGGWDQVRRGLAYVSSFNGCFLWFVFPAAVLIVFRRIKKSLPLLVILVVSVVYLTYVVAVGGDFKSSFRFVIPVLAAFCLIVQASFARLWEIVENRKPGAAWVIFAAALALTVPLGWHVHTGSPKLKAKYERMRKAGYPNYIDRARAIGQWLRKNAREGDRLAISTTGAISFFSGISVIDMLGLHDIHIARSKAPQFGTGLAGHECGDAAYVLSLKPRFIILSQKRLPSPVPPRKPHSELWSELQLIQSPDFIENYEPKIFKACNNYFLVYCRKD